MSPEPDLTSELDAAEDIVLGRKLWAARKQRGWTLREAEKHSGVPNAHISQIETGAIRRPEAATLIRLAEAYGLPSAELIAIAGREVVEVVTEWGVRYEGEDARTVPYGTSRVAEHLARLDARTDVAKVVRRTVTYGPWEEVPGEH